MKRTRAALLLLDQNDRTRGNFSAVLFSGSIGRRVHTRIDLCCCRGGTTRLTAHRGHEAHAVLHEANTRLPLLRKSVGRSRRRMGRSFHSPQTPYPKWLSQPRLLIGLVRDHACPYGSAPHIGARPQPRFCSARRSSAGGRPGRQLSRTQVQPRRLVKLLRVDAPLRRRLRVVSRRAVNFAQRCKGRRVILLGLPGAFTPT